MIRQELLKWNIPRACRSDTYRWHKRYDNLAKLIHICMFALSVFGGVMRAVFLRVVMKRVVRPTISKASPYGSILLGVMCCGFLLGYLGVRDTFAQQSVTGGAAVVGGVRVVDDARYRIGPGDVLAITVRKAAELSGPVRVDQRGMIHIPMIEGEVRAACLTESELAAQITNLYLEYKRNPTVEVFVTEFQSRPVAVIGAVNSPGQFRLQRQVRLLELLSFAGGPAPRAGRIINVIHTTGPSICEANPNEPQATNEELTMYKLNETMKGRDETNPFVRPGDIISLPDADQVFIIGHVMAPQAISLRDKPVTISRAIAITGGPTRDSKTTRIRIIRQLGEGGAKQEIFVNLDAVLKQKAEDIALLPNDIVEVPSSAGKTILGALTGAIAPTLTQLPIRAIP